jgi:hypothetical protein
MLHGAKIPSAAHGRRAQTYTQLGQACQYAASLCEMFRHFNSCVMRNGE